MCKKCISRLRGTGQVLGSLSIRVHQFRGTGNCFQVPMYIPVANRTLLPRLSSIVSPVEWAVLLFKGIGGKRGQRWVKRRREMRDSQAQAILSSWTFRTNNVCIYLYVSIFSCVLTYSYLLTFQSSVFPFFSIWRVINDRASANLGEKCCMFIFSIIVIIIIALYWNCNSSEMMVFESLWRLRVCSYFLLKQKHNLVIPTLPPATPQFLKFVFIATKVVNAPYSCSLYLIGISTQAHQKPVYRTGKLIIMYKFS